MSRRRRMCRIGALPEGCETEPADGVDEALALFTQLAIGLDDALDSRCDLVLRHRGTDYLAERRGAIGRATEADLVPLLAVLVDAEYADVTDMMVATGVHAAGHFDLDLAEVVEIVEIIEALLDLLRHRDGAGVGERAEVESRAGDHVGQGTDVRHCEAERSELVPHLVKSVLRHIPEQQVLRVGAADETEAHALGEGRHALHLRGGHVARHRTVSLEGHEHGPVARHAVWPRVVAVPGLEGKLASRSRIVVLERLVGLWLEESADPLDLGRGELRCGGAARLPLGLDLRAEALDAE